MARQGQGDENGNGNHGPPWFWDFVTALFYSLLRTAEQWQRLVEDRQRSRKPGTLLVPTSSQVAHPCSRTKEDAPLPLNENTDGDGNWGDIDNSLAMETNPDDLVIPVNIDLQGDFSFPPLADQHPEIQAPLQDIHIDPVDPAEADLAILLVQGEVVGLLQQIQRDEANIVPRLQMLPPIAEEALVPLDLVADIAVGVLPAPEVDADDDALIFEMTPIDAPDLGAAVMDNTTLGLAFSILPQEIERHEANMVGRPNRVHEIVEVLNVHDKLFLVNLGLQLLQAALNELCESFKVSQDLLIPSAVQQALIPAVNAVDSASWEVELAVYQGQDEANTARHPQVPSTSTSEEVLVPPDLVGGVAVGGSQHLPTILQAPQSVTGDVPEHDIFPASDSSPVSFRADSREPEINGADALTHDIGAAGIIAMDALDLPQHFETNGPNPNLFEPNEVEDEAGETSVQHFIQLASLASSDPGHPRVATASLSVPAGDLNSHLELQMPSAVTKGGVTEAEATLPDEI